MRRSELALLMIAIALPLTGCATLGPRPGLLDPGAETGLASYYADRHHGKPTASGALYDRDDMVAAHRTLPFGTRVRVTNLENDRSVVVTVIDRGPFKKGRIIDVSRRAARELDFIRQGLVRVRIAVLGS